MTSLKQKVTHRKNRTVYAKSVKPPTTTMLKRGKNNAKLGDVVLKKKWYGMRIYSLTLEERVSCPIDCAQWNNCYGNNMPFAHRYDHTHPDFYKMLGAHISELSAKHPEGFVVRLHVLGDFFDLTYVLFWRLLMNLHRNLHVFGYTHQSYLSEIGKQIMHMNTSWPDRFAVRYSDQFIPYSAWTTDDSTFVPEKGIVCPEQLGKTDSCATCAYCWTSTDPVYFLEH